METADALTDEQREALELEREQARLKTRDGQAQEFRDGLMQALTALNHEIAGQGAQPRIDAVIQALTMLQAEFVAMEPNRNRRRMIEAEIAHNLRRLVTLRMSTGSKPAKPLEVN